MLSAAKHSLKHKSQHELINTFFLDRLAPEQLRCFFVLVLSKPHSL